MKAIVGEGSCGLAAGAGKVYAALEARNTGKYEMGVTGCIGMCFLEPIVDIYDGKELKQRLVRVSEGDAEDIAAAM